MPVFRFLIAIIVWGLTASGAVATAADLDPEKKAAFENQLVGNWAVPENKYKTTIEFTFAKDRTFTCTYAEPDKDMVEWAGQWKVRSTKDGVMAFLKGQSQQDEAKWMKAAIQTDKAMNIFAIRITWDFKVTSTDVWQSRLEKIVPETEEGGKKSKEKEEEEEEEAEETGEEEAEEEQ